MGLFSQAKAAPALSEAQRAYTEGRTVFVARYWDEMMNYQGTGIINGADHFIEGIEQAGWELQQLSYAWVPEKKRGISVMTFRRRAPQYHELPTSEYRPVANPNFPPHSYVPQH